MPRMFPRIQVQKLVAGELAIIDVALRFNDAPLTGQTVSFVLRRGSDGFYWSGSTFLSGYRVVNMVERGSNPSQVGVYRFNFQTPQPDVPIDEVFDWSVERVAPNDTTFLVKGRIISRQVGVNIVEGDGVGSRSGTSVVPGATRIGGFFGRRELSTVQGVDAISLLLVGDCTPVIIGTIESTTPQVVWNLRPFQNQAQDCCARRWRIMNLFGIDPPFIGNQLAGGFIDCSGVFTNLPDELVGGFVVKWELELQIACVSGLGAGFWPTANGA